jgi:threonyl-tRNA synthetase
LKAYLTFLEEAEKRDHRRLGREMELFHFQEEAPGMVFWHPNGWTIYRALEDYMRRRLTRAGYREIKTPRSSTASCGRPPATGTSTARTCSSPRSTRNMPTRSG